MPYQPTPLAAVRPMPCTCSQPTTAICPPSCLQAPSLLHGSHQACTLALGCPMRVFPLSFPLHSGSIVPVLLPPCSLSHRTRSRPGMPLGGKEYEEDNGVNSQEGQGVKAVSAGPVTGVRVLFPFLSHRRLEDFAPVWERGSRNTFLYIEIRK